MNVTMHFDRQKNQNIFFFFFIVIGYFRVDIEREAEFITFIDLPIDLPIYHRSGKVLELGTNIAQQHYMSTLYVGTLPQGYQRWQTNIKCSSYSTFYCILCFVIW